MSRAGGIPGLQVGEGVNNERAGTARSRDK